MNTTDQTFFHLGIAPKMLGILERMKIVTPTPIQLRAIPEALAGKDVVGIAQTGTGKTLAFGIPMVQRLIADFGQGLVVVPTRELAIQVDQVMHQILKPHGLRSAVLIGGASMSNQINALHKKPAVLICTPGRLIDHLEQRTLKLKEVRVLVLDEADRMFDMGFAPQVRRILQALPRKRQNLLFSATMPSGIVQLATQHMHLPIHVEIAPSGTAAEQVTQELFIIREESKKTLLKHLLNQYRGAILVFTRTKIKARKIKRVIQEARHKVAEIHSDRTLAQRKQAIAGFKEGSYRVLVATDIAARGIDVTGIEVVINYDLPDDTENYVHRIGRTGRAGQEGHSIALATPDQRSDVVRIEHFLKKAIPISQHPEVPAAKFSKPQSRSFRPKRFGKGKTRRWG